MPTLRLHKTGEEIFCVRFINRRRRFERTNAEFVYGENRRLWLRSGWSASSLGKISRRFQSR